MQVKINGQQQTVDNNISVSNLLKILNYTDSQSIAVAINLEFIQRSNYSSVLIKEQDDIEIVTPMQGG
jgi:thiamine biosynthesis protein ThiS